MDIFIETPRLIIRELLPEDAAGMYVMDADPEVHRYVGRNPVSHLAQIDEVIAFIRSQYVTNGIGRWAVIEKADGQFIGWIGFKRITETVNGHSGFLDFGYRFTRSKWGEGFATEAARAALDYGLELLKPDKVFAMTDVDNVASRKVLERLGFKLAGIFPYDGAPGWREPGEPATWYELHVAAQHRQTDKASLDISRA